MLYLILIFCYMCQYIVQCFKYPYHKIAFDVNTLIILTLQHISRYTNIYKYGILISSNEGKLDARGVPTWAACRFPHLNKYLENRIVRTP